MNDNKYKFFITQDETCGMYDENSGDILHSKTGAKKEAYEKFIMPVLNSEVYKDKKTLNIADICFGTGYNTKSALLNFKNRNINIDAFEISKEFIFLSLLINDGIQNSDIKIKLAEKYITNGINFEEIIKCYNQMNQNDAGLFFDPVFTSFIEKIKNWTYNLSPCNINSTFLHNIYYDYISESMKDGAKFNHINNFNFRLLIGDARKLFPRQNTEYDVIFLDGYSPQINPVLWTIDFLSAIKSRMNKNSILVSYSKSTPFRSSLVKLGFCVGKTIINDTDFGTVASENKNNIKTPLDDFDTGLINTRSGIPYKDSCLNLKADIILKNREREMKVSDLISHTKFLKENNKTL